MARLLLTGRGRGDLDDGHIEEGPAIHQLCVYLSDSMYEVGGCLVAELRAFVGERARRPDCGHYVGLQALAVDFDRLVGIAVHVGLVERREGDLAMTADEEI